MTEPSQKALDYAARKAGYNNWVEACSIAPRLADLSIVAHAQTLNELWALKPPKTRGELFAEEMRKRGNGCHLTFPAIAAEMINEGWEPKDD